MGCRMGLVGGMSLPVPIASEAELAAVLRDDGLVLLMTRSSFEEKKFHYTVVYGLGGHAVLSDPLQVRMGWLAHL
jgi:hypothetical protein